MPGMESSDQRIIRTPERRLPAGTGLPRGKARARRWWAIRSSTALVLLAAVLCLFVIWNRDRSVARRLLATLEPVARELQRQTNTFGVIPAHVPDPPPVGQSRFGFAHTFSADERQFAIDSGKPCIIAYTQSVRLLLHRDGRCVIYHENGQISAVWMTEDDFAERILQQDRLVEEFQAERRSRPVQLP